MRKILATLLFITTFSSWSQNCNLYYTGQFVPSVQQPDDSVFYLVTLASVYEMHVNKGWRNIYDINWYGYCDFTMKLDETSNPDADENGSPQIKCNLSFINDSSLSFSRDGKTEIMQTFQDGSVWMIMMDRDNELKENDLDSALMGLEELYSGNDSLNAFLQFMQGLKGLTGLMEQAFTISKTEKEAIALLLNCIQHNDWQTFYENSSNAFKDQIASIPVQQYFNYISNAFGKWEYFRVKDQSMNFPLLEDEQSSGSKFVFMVKFEKCREEAELSITLSNENDVKTPDKEVEGIYALEEGKKTFQLIRITPEDNDPCVYIENLTADFFKNFYAKKYAKIYKNCSPYLKAEATKPEISDILSLANSMRKNQPFKLYTHTFGIDKKYGGLIAALFVAETSSKYIILTLTYLADGSGQLAGVKIKESDKDTD